MRLRLVANVRREQSKLDGLLANVCERSRTFSFIGHRAVLAPNVWANENPKIDTCFRKSNSGPSDCEADALTYDHGHTGTTVVGA